MGSAKLIVILVSPGGVILGYNVANIIINFYRQ